MTAERACSKTSVWENQLTDDWEIQLYESGFRIRAFRSAGKEFTMRIMTIAWKVLLETLTANVLAKKVMTQAR